MNKSEGQAILSLEHTDLQDGEHHCLITNRQFVVKDGKIQRLELSPKQAIILSYAGEHIQGKTVVRVQVNGIATKLGETVAVVGNCPELGSWNPSTAYQLEYVNQNTWFGEIPFNESAGKSILYKYILLRPNSTPMRENLVSRRWTLPEYGILKWCDSWVD